MCERRPPAHEGSQREREFQSPDHRTSCGEGPMAECAESVARYGELALVPVLAELVDADDWQRQRPVVTVCDIT